MLSRRQQPATPADLQIEIRRNQVCKDQSFRSDEEDHAPPVNAAAYFYMLLNDPDLLTMSSTHSHNSLSLLARVCCIISTLYTRQTLSTFQAPTDNGRDDHYHTNTQENGMGSDADKHYSQRNGECKRPEAGARHQFSLLLAIVRGLHNRLLLLLRHCYFVHLSVLL